MSIAKYATRNPKSLAPPEQLDPRPLSAIMVYEFFAAAVNVLHFLLVRIPLVTGTVLGVVAALVWLGPSAAAAVLVAPPAVIGGLGAIHPGFRSWLRTRARCGWRRWWVYSRQWQPVLVAHGLAVSRGQEVPMVPRLLPRATCDEWSDLLRVDLVPGLSPEDMEREAPNLAHAFGARSCTVTVVKPGRVTLSFATRDRLALPVPAMPIPTWCDLTAVPVGVQEDGNTWAVRILGTHLLIAGATGAGKGSVLWSLLRGLTPEIASGRVQVWGIDPKGGMELSFGDPLFARLVSSSVEDMADLLEDAVAVMNDRVTRLAGHTRLHEPSIAEPLILLVIDELASLTSYVPNRDTRKRVDLALQQLLTKGRAPGVCVIGALQDPRKEVLAYRDLFPTRVALRLAEREQVGMVLGDAAWQLGAHCERIPHALPGVGYVYLDGQREPVRVRAGHVTDTDILDMAAAYPALSLRPDDRWIEPIHQAPAA